MWKDIEDKEKRDKEFEEEKEQTRKDRLEQLMEEARALGNEHVTEKDIDMEDLPPVEVGFCFGVLLWVSARDFIYRFYKSLL